MTDRSSEPAFCPPIHNACDAPPLSDQCRHCRTRDGAVGTARVDLGQADREDLAFGGLLVGDAPAKVDVGEDDRTLLAGAAQAREGQARETVALGREVAEGRGDEDADGARGGVRHREAPRLRFSELSHAPDLQFVPGGHGSPAEIAAQWHLV